VESSPLLIAPLSSAAFSVALWALQVSSPVLWTRTLPSRLQRFESYPHHSPVSKNVSDLAPCIEFDLPQALAANERLRWISNERACVQPNALQFGCGQAPSADPSDYANRDSGSLPFLQSAQHSGITDLRVVDQEFFPGSLDELVSSRVHSPG
jgi:hypothetical protein